MRRFFYILMFTGVGFLLGFGAWKIKAEIIAKREAKKKHTAYATHPVTENKNFVIITYAKNNEKTCEQNLLSALNQEYESFRVIYIDDGSKKEAFATARAYISNHDFNGRVTLIQNKEEEGEVESIYRAIHSCKNDELVILLGGEESFAHSGVLAKLNRYFADPDVWMTAAEEVRVPAYNKSIGPLFYQTFYAGLFKQIKLQDFLEEGKFSQKGCENIMTSPLKALAGKHAYHVQEPFFLSRKEKKIELRQENYHCLGRNPWHDFSRDEELVDIVIFSYNRPLQLYAFLESSEKYVENLHRQFVIYRVGNTHYEKGYDKVKEAFPNVIYIRQSIETPYEDFAPMVRKVVFNRDFSIARYVTFALDDHLIKDQIDLKEGVKLLKETGAHGFYFRLGNNLDDHPEERKVEVEEGVYAWQFSKMEGEWGAPNSVRMALFKKEDIHSDFLHMKFHNPNILQALWNKQANLLRVGLYYDQSKVVRLPLNTVMENEWIHAKSPKISTKDLLTTFEQGLKMDISSLERLENKKVELEISPRFVKR
ncbi:glycosyltransferase [Candidatus Neptunochlamydia vexilliferae]|nr:glycosyltransferase [Candidatus Neptunochlamydia vexilliferae]